MLRNYEFSFANQFQVISYERSGVMRMLNRRYWSQLHYCNVGKYFTWSLEPENIDISKLWWKRSQMTAADIFVYWPFDWKPCRWLELGSRWNLWLETGNVTEKPRFTYLKFYFVNYW